jgi:hypothetical protein
VHPLLQVPYPLMYPLLQVSLTFLLLVTLWGHTSEIDYSALFLVIAIINCDRICLVASHNTNGSHIVVAW